MSINGRITRNLRTLGLYPVPAMGRIKLEPASLRRRKLGDFAQDSQLGVLIFHAIFMQVMPKGRPGRRMCITKNKKDKKSRHGLKKRPRAKCHSAVKGQIEMGNS
jgi:hypothetical protein